jgi:uncharacterized membrane protein
MRITPGLVLGIGLGGFLDGIALHQIAQWHNMGSAVLPPTTMAAMRTNMRWDGYFHLATWLITIFGLLLLRRDAVRGLVPGLKTFVGQLTLGWGLFNLVEGIIDHEILNLHHVRDLPVRVPTYDWIFLGVFGIGLILLGALLSRADRRTPTIVYDQRNAA